MPDEDGGLLKTARYVPEVHLGHLLQIAATVAAAVGTAGGIYFGIIAHLADNDRRIAVHDQRLVAVEAYVTRVDDAEKTLANSTAAKLDSIQSSLADLRVLVAGLGHDAPRR